MYSKLIDNLMQHYLKISTTYKWHIPFGHPMYSKKDRQLDAALFKNIDLNAVGVFGDHSQQYKD
jgi:hypothetical protein